MTSWEVNAYDHKKLVLFIGGIWSEKRLTITGDPDEIIANDKTHDYIYERTTPNVYRLKYKRPSNP